MSQKPPEATPWYRLPGTDLNPPPKMSSKEYLEQLETYRTLLERLKLKHWLDRKVATPNMVLLTEQIHILKMQVTLIMTVRAGLEKFYKIQNAKPEDDELPKAACERLEAVYQQRMHLEALHQGGIRWLFWAAVIVACFLWYIHDQHMNLRMAPQESNFEDFPQYSAPSTPLRRF